MIRNVNVNEPQNQQSCQTSVMGSNGYENEIFNEDCLQTMSRMDKGIIDAIVTSPPYNTSRKGSSLDGVGNFKMRLSGVVEEITCTAAGRALLDDANAVAQKTTLGLENVTNESKATMFINATLTGNPTAPTQTAGNNSTRLATTAYVDGKIAYATLVEHNPAKAIFK